MNTRKRYTKQEKLMVLYEYSLGKKSNEAFFAADIEIERANDKKYAAKLINKWKKELYLKRKPYELFFDFSQIQIIKMQKQLKKIKIDENDIIAQDYMAEFEKQNNGKIDTFY